MITSIRTMHSNWNAIWALILHLYVAPTSSQESHGSIMREEPSPELYCLLDSDSCLSKQCIHWDRNFCLQWEDTVIPRATLSLTDQMEAHISL